MIERNESIALAQATLAEAGWKPMPGWGDYVHGPCVGGIDPWGTGHVKSLEMIPPGHPQYGPDTPDEHHEAAAWLVEHAKRLANPVAPAPEAEETAGHETHGETGEHQHADGQDSAESIAADISGEVDFADWNDQGVAPEAERPIDADFTLETLDLIEPPEPDFGGELLDYQGEIEPEAEQAQGDPGGVAYFGDNIHTIRLAKLGRLSQIARELKAALQDGWTLAEFASLQNLIVRIDRGEAPDDPDARARFLWINDRSASMSRIDAFKDAREAELESADRASVEAFDVEEGWP